MIPKKSLDSVLDKSIILTITAPNDNAKSISVQCAPQLDEIQSNCNFVLNVKMIKEEGGKS